MSVVRHLNKLGVERRVRCSRSKNCFQNCGCLTPELKCKGLVKLPMTQSRAPCAARERALSACCCLRRVAWGVVEDVVVVVVVEEGGEEEEGRPATIYRDDSDDTPDAASSRLKYHPGGRSSQLCVERTTCCVFKVRHTTFLGAPKAFAVLRPPSTPRCSVLSRNLP